MARKCETASANDRRSPLGPVIIGLAVLALLLPPPPPPEEEEEGPEEAGGGGTPEAPLDLGADKVKIIEVC
jgi:hypothetical protein